MKKCKRLAAHPQSHAWPNIIIQYDSTADLLVVFLAVLIHLPAPEQKLKPPGVHISQNCFQLYFKQSSIKDCSSCQEALVSNQRLGAHVHPLNKGGLQRLPDIPQ